MWLQLELGERKERILRTAKSHSKNWVVSPTFLEPGDYDVEDWLELIRRNMVYLVSVAEERQDLTSSVIQAL